MFALYLNPDFLNAVKLHYPRLTSIQSLDDIRALFSYSDLNVMQAQSALVIQHLETRKLKKMGFMYPKLSDDTDVAHAKVDPKTILASLNASEVEKLSIELNEDIDTLACTCINESTLLLYASDGTGDKTATTLESVFCAMALIMSQGAVMQTGMYEQFVQNM